MRLTLEERLVRHIAEPDERGCLVWTGARMKYGYGWINMKHSDGTWSPTPAHRVVYEFIVGPIPDGLHIDHLCNNPPCVNPAHLEAVTKAENGRRIFLRRRHPNQHKTHCKLGHRIDGLDSLGRRFCKECMRDTNRRSTERLGKRTCPHCGKTLVTLTRHTRTFHPEHSPGKGWRLGVVG